MPMVDSPSFNLSDALLQSGGDAAVLREIIELFVQDLPKREADLRLAMERRDAKLLERTAHTLKGSCLTFAAAAAGEAALRVETFGRAGDFEGAREAVDRLAREISRLTPDLKRFLDAPSP
jgi:two-component system sensor histidine kinase/response regulator